MATKTEIYEFRKKEENDFYNVEDFNNNMDMMETALTEFDDSGTAEGVTSFPEMLAKLVTGNKLAVTLKNLKAGLQFVLHAGSIVNNCVTDNPNLPLSAAQGKALQDLINVLNNEQQKLSSNINDKIYYLRPRETKTWTLRAPSFLMIGASDTTAALLYITGNGFKVLSKLPDSDISPIISVSNYHVTITNPQDWGINVIMLYA